MSNNPNPGNARVISLFISFFILFVVLFSLGVLVGKGLTERDATITEKTGTAPPRVEIPEPPVQREPKELEEIKEVRPAQDGPLEEPYQALRIEEPGAAAGDESVKELPGYDVPEPAKAPDEQALQKNGGEAWYLSASESALQSPVASESKINVETEDIEAERAAREEKSESERRRRDLRVKLPPVDPDGKYTVQIGSFIDKKSAEFVLRSMESKGYPVYMNTMTSKDNKIWYRVRVGTFNSLETARDYGDSLKVLEPEVKVVFITQNE